MADLKDLGDKLLKAAARLDQASSDAASHAAFSMVKYLAESTPVDTSKALSNWRVSITGPALGVIEAHYIGVDGSTRGSSMSETVNAASIQLRAKKAGQAIYISNSVEYLTDLNEGSSPQAPAGFIEGVSIVGSQALANYKLDIFK